MPTPRPSASVSTSSRSREAGSSSTSSAPAARARVERPVERRGVGRGDVPRSAGGGLEAERDQRLGRRQRAGVEAHPPALVHGGERLQRPRAHQPPAGEDADAGADALGLREQVRVDEEGGPARQLGGEELADLHPPERVHAVGGLVEHQEVRRADQRRGQPEPLAHPLAEAADSPLGRLAEAHPVEQRVQARGGPGEPLQPGHAGQEGARGPRAGQCEPLREVAHPGAGARDPPAGPRAARTSPASGWAMPSRHLMKVVLPAPFGPISPNASPRGTSRSTPSSATDSVRPSRVRKRLCKRADGECGRHRRQSLPLPAVRRCTPGSEPPGASRSVEEDQEHHPGLRHHHAGAQLAHRPHDRIVERHRRRQRPEAPGPHPPQPPERQGERSGRDQRRRARTPDRTPGPGRWSAACSQVASEEQGPGQTHRRHRPGTPAGPGRGERSLVLGRAGHGLC